MTLFLALAAMLSQIADPAPASAQQTPITVTIDHPNGVEASTLARSIKGGALVVPKTYDGKLAVMGTVVSIQHNSDGDVAFLETNSSPDHLKAYIVSDPHLRLGALIGLACKKANGTETTAEVSECSIINAPGMKPYTMTFTPVN